MSRGGRGNNLTDKMLRGITSIPQTTTSLNPMNFWNGDAQILTSLFEGSLPSVQACSYSPWQGQLQKACLISTYPCKMIVQLRDSSLSQSSDRLRCSESFIGFHNLRRLANICQHILQICRSCVRDLAKIPILSAGS